MRTKTMEGLIGAGVNMDLMNVPVRVYKEARRKNDLGTMERAMGYAQDFAKEAEKYKASAEEGMKEDAEDAKEKAKEALEETIEKRKNERKEMQAEIEEKQKAESADAKGSAGEDATGAAIAGTGTDSLEVSSEGRILAENIAKPDVCLQNKPVIYSKSGEIECDHTKEEPKLAYRL